MLFCCQGRIRSRWAVLRSPAWLLVAACALTHHFAWSQSPEAVVPPQDREWTQGPTNISLGNQLKIEVPLGYFYGDASLAARKLQTDGNMVPSNLAALFGKIGGGYAILTLTPMEHIKVDDASPVDAKVSVESLKDIARRQNRLGKVTLKSLDYITPPAFDPENQRMTWAVAVEAGASAGQVLKFQNRTARVLGRRSVLDVTVPLPPNLFGAQYLTIEDVLANVQFGPGEKYSDFQEGEKSRILTTTELAALDPEDISTRAAAASGKWALFIWIAIGSLAAVGTTLLVVKMRHARPAPRSALSPRRSAEAASSDPEPVFARTIAAARKAGSEPSQPVPAPAAANGNGKSSKTQKSAKTNGNSSQHRHRDFDYNRYFNDLMSSVSGHMGYGTDGQSVTRIVAAPANGNQTVVPAAAGAQSVPSAMEIHSQMIANQRSLIEEQRRLIYEQTKLIEEKSKLIAEKNQLLDRQTELLENKLL